MSYYWFNRQELLQKAKYKYHNYDKYKNLSEEQKEAKRKYGQDRYKKMKDKSS